MPFVSVTDLPATYQALQDIRDLRARGAVDRVITGHDPSELSQVEPYTPELEGIAGVIGRLKP